MLERPNSLPCPITARLALTALAGVVATTAVGCAGKLMQPSDYHLGRAGAAPAAAAAPTPRADDVTAASDIPAIVGGPGLPPRPRNGPVLETYSVVVNDVEISELLFAMARDAKIDVDVHPSIRGKVSLNAINQTLPQILSRLARQINLRYEFDGRNLVVLPDDAFVRHYTVDYVNISRDSTANTSIATQIASAGRDPVGTTTSTLSNNSTTQIVNTSNNRFWNTLIGNLRALIDDVGPADASNQALAARAAGAGANGGAAAGVPDAAAAGSANIIPSPETGIVTVRATQRQHERVREYLDRLLNSARRQVMIEATIAEVQLSEEFQQGINWQKVRNDGSGWAFTQQPSGPSPLGTGAVPGSGPGGITFQANPGPGNNVGGAVFGGSQTPALGVLRYLSTGAAGSIGAAVSLLHGFGKVKVLSSPKISVLNNQTAVLKVVDNRVYFTIGVQVTPGSVTAAPLVTYTSTPNTVPVGFVMAVTPQIEETGSVTINVRPTISRIIGYVTDPNSALASSNVTSRIPEIQTREIESILKVTNGDVAVMGGLMQESVDYRTDGVPGAAGVPIFGNLFKYRNENSSKSELVIFLRPVVVRDASLEGDYRHLKGLQPGEDFFSKPDFPAVPQAWVRQDTTRRSPANAAATDGDSNRRQSTP
ncbi:MAG: type II and III secretion system protein [Burkholderiaceae bacterium]